ncbi:cytidylate kinase [Methanomicrobium sp. W14]|uniref:(d)CMP kinase n=1 Tax=Methanomicrobium sp. W14 TaxID=2817839 RepID=UPI001AE4C67F|nr:AAA family ATPase [Methanomicrobium sp. W14]MBP2133145.1 cytidylate kinase [Methanomicrobium sp. W14]
MKITISGPPGSGTTSLAKYLSSKYSFELISAGEVFRSLAREKGVSLIEFGELCEQNPDVDRLIDEKQKEIGESKENIIIEGRLAGRMVGNADLRVWIAASPDCRAERIAEREGVSFESAKSETFVREKSESERYKKYYNIDICDLSVYDLVISSEKWGKEELARVVDSAVENLKV